MFNAMVIFSVFLQACSTMKFSSVISESDEGDAQNCEMNIVSTFPYPGATDMYYRGLVEAELSGSDPDAFILLFDEDGVEVSGATYRSENKIYFQPESPLSGLSSYSAQISYCGSTDPVELEFTTSELGSSLQQGHQMLIDKTFALDLSSGEVVQPKGLGDALQGLLRNIFLVQVEQANETRLQLRMTLSMADEFEQNFCVPTLEEFPPLMLVESPYFILEESDVPIMVENHSMTFYKLGLSGTIAPDGSYFGHVGAEGVMDLREVYPILANFGLDVSDVDEFCSVISEFDVTCQPCASDEQSYCVPLVLKDLLAEEVQMDLYPVSDPNCHVNCQDNLETCSSPQE